MGITKKYIALYSVKGKFTYYKVMQIILQADLITVLFTAY